MCEVGGTALNLAPHVEHRHGAFLFVTCRGVSNPTAQFLGGILMSISFNPGPSSQPVYDVDSTPVPNTTEQSVRRQSILQDWANVGLSADIMRPRHDEEQVWPSSVHDSADDWQQQSYCCR